MEMLWFLLMGHLVGDYLLQSAWMAYNKKENFIPCFMHCTAYTMAVSLSLIMCPTVNTVPFSLMFWLFMSHWIVDRYEWLDHWFDLLKARSWNSVDAQLDDDALIHHSVAISFGAIVYTVADNTLHLLMMTWLLYKYY